MWSSWIRWRWADDIPEAEAVIFPQVLGEAYRRVPAFQAIRLPILLITSEFGTLSMWDWEIAEYLRSHGVETIGPYNLRQAQIVCRALAVKRELRETKFLVYQDDPGEGHQASIFKRFYWWEDECTQRLHDKFGLTVIKRSFRELGAAAKRFPDVGGRPDVGRADGCRRTGFRRARCAAPSRCTWRSAATWTRIRRSARPASIA